MKKIVLVLFLFVSILTGCGKMIYLMPEYVDMKIEGKTLVIADMDIFIGNPKDVTDDLGEGNPQKVYREFFEYNFVGRMAQLSTFDEVHFAQIINKDEFSERVFEISKSDKIYMNIPSDGQVAQTDSLYGNFILFIQDYQVGRTDAKSGSAMVFTPNAGGGGSWSGGGGGSFPDLRINFNFVIWDNDNKQVVSYGMVNCPTTFIFAMTTETWNTSITNIANWILADTPFENFPEPEKPSQNKESRMDL